MMKPEVFQEKLESSVGKKVKLKINDNRSTMLSVKWEQKCMRISLHRMFLFAPRNIMDELACYLKREVDSMTPRVKAFMERSLQKLDCSYLVRTEHIYSKGNVYNLERLYNEINKTYFNNTLDLKISWFGSPYGKTKSKVIFGLYHDHLKLVKINRLLDCSAVPEYVVSFVIYHEMLHHVCRSYYDFEGKHRIHTKEFKKRESLFQHYELAQKWIKENHNIIFK